MSSASPSLLDRWNRTWFQPASTQTLGLVRFFVTLTFVMKMVGTWGLWKGTDGLRFLWPAKHSYGYGEYVSPVTAVEWLHLPVPTVAQFRTAEEVALYAALFFCVGLFTRVSGAVLSSLLVYFLLSSQWNYLHHVNVYTWALTLLAIAPSGDHYSVDALLRRQWARWRGLPAPTPPLRPILWQRLIVVFVSILYVSTTVAKLGPAWFDGQLMQMMVDDGWAKGPFLDGILTVMTPLTLSWWTLFAEGMLGFGLLFPQTRRFAAWCGMALHLGIDMMMNVTTFSYLMISLYLAAAAPSTGESTLRVDPTRPEQRLFGGLVRALDWGQRFTVRTDGAGPLTVQPPGGPALRGVHAVLRCLGLMPLTYLAGFPLDAAAGLLRRRGAAQG